MPLPETPRIQYNGVTLERPQIRSLRVTPVYDAEERIVQYVEVAISATGYLFELGGSNQQDTTSPAKQLSVAKVLAKLSAPRKSFLWWEKGGETNPTLEIRPSHVMENLPAKAESLSKETAGSIMRAVGFDVWWGPKASCEVLSNWPCLLLVRLDILARVNPALVMPAWQEARSGAAPGNNIMSHTSSVTYSIDQNHYSTRTVIGTLTYRANLVKDADDYRADVFSGGALDAAGVAASVEKFTHGIPLPQNFVREVCQYAIGAQRNAIHYIVVDREVYRVPPNPATRVEVQVEVIAENMSTLSFEKRLTGVIEGNRLTSKAQLLSVLLELLETHIMSTPLVFVYHARLLDFLYENRVAFDFQAVQAPGLAYTSFREAGIFIDPPTDPFHFAQALRGTANLSGSAYNLLKPEQRRTRPEPWQTIWTPPSVTGAVEGALEKKGKDLYEQYIKDYRQTTGKDLEEGVVNMQESVQLRYIEPGQTTRKTAKRNDDGSIEDETSETTIDCLGDLYIVVHGFKLGMEDTAGNPPLTPNPVAIWGDDDAIRARIPQQITAGKGQVPLSGRVKYQNVNPATKLRSKLGGRDLYLLRWSYIIRMEPVLVKLIRSGMEAKGRWAEVLRGVTWPAQDAYGLAEELKKILWEAPKR